MHAAEWKYGSMLNRAAAENHQACYLGTDIDYCTTIFLVIICQSALSRRERFEHHPFHIEAGSLYSLYQILASGARTGHDMNERLEPGTAHTHRFGNAVLPVDDKFLRQT